MAERNEEFFEQRLAKLQRLRERGVDPYPARFRRSHTAAEAAALYLQHYAGTAEGRSREQVTVVGRITALRIMGRAAFLDLRDGSGKIQCYFRVDTLGEEGYRGLQNLDLGDFLGATGPLFRTRTGEITVDAQDYTLLSKSLQPPPEKWHGLADIETRYRQRYLDLMSSEEVRATFLARSSIVSSVRRFLDGRGFMEVETPMLLPQAGGAMARPFVTHHNALNQDFYLRIATELHLKRLLVGGYERVYEIGRIFRNEGIDARHNPEFTTLESYEAYADYEDVMAMVEEMVRHAAREVLGTTQVVFREAAIDLEPPWRRWTLQEAIGEHTGIDILKHDSAGELREAMAGKRLHAPADLGYGKLVDELLSAHVEPRLVQPTFILDYPIEMSPLAKSKKDNPRLVERFEGYIGGMEVANAFSELNDPLEQRQRFLQQARLRSEGDEEAELPDEDFLFALEHGMPPAGGLGVGIDRLAMLFTDNPSIREVILFPLLRRKE